MIIRSNTLYVKMCMAEKNIMKCQKALVFHINSVTNAILSPVPGYHEYIKTWVKSIFSVVGLLLACAQIQVCVHSSLHVTEITATVFTILSGENMPVCYVGIL